MKHLREWFRQWFHRSVYLEDSPGGWTLWIERRWAAYFFFIPEDSILGIAKRLNAVETIGLSYKLGIAGIDRVDYVVIPNWAFTEARRLITVKALEAVKA